MNFLYLTFVKKPYLTREQNNDVLVYGNLIDSPFNT